MGYRKTVRGIRPGTITSVELADGAVTGPKLSVEALDGKVITGTWIRTVDPAELSNRVELGTDPAAPVEGEKNSVRFYQGGTVGLNFTGLVDLTAADDGSGAFADVWSILRLFLTETKGSAEIQLKGGWDSESDTELVHTVTRPSGSTTFLGHRFVGGVDVDRLKIGRGPMIGAGVDFGWFDGTTDASGDVFVSHNLGVPPVAINVNGGNCLPRAFGPGASTATKFRVVCHTADASAVLANARATFYWEAIA